MAKADLGTKYTCEACGTKFYDLNRETFACPSCGLDPRADEKEAEPTPAADEIAVDLVDAEAEDEDATEDVDASDDEDEDEDDMDVEEIELDDASAEARLLEMSGGDDDDVDMPSEGLGDDDDMDVGELEDVSFDSNDGDSEDS
ncbi:MAG: FYDLN acid domain-containing protein [Bradymonadia bacterium]